MTTYFGDGDGDRVELGLLRSLPCSLYIMADGGGTGRIGFTDLLMDMNENVWIGGCEGRSYSLSFYNFSGTRGANRYGRNGYEQMIN